VSAALSVLLSVLAVSVVMFVNKIKATETLRRARLVL
jgi:hypothetical protein